MNIQKNSSPFLSRPLPRAPRPHGRRGFSLVEMLAVLLIIGIIFVIGGGEIQRAWKRQKVQSASGDIRVLFQRAYSEVQRRGIPVFVQVGPRVVAGSSEYLPIYLIGDQTQDQVLDCFQKVPDAGCPDLLIDQYKIIVKGLTGTLGTTGVDQEFCLSSLNKIEIQSTLWSDNTTDWNVAHVIMCDLQGRAMQVVLKAGKPTSTGRQIGAPATLVFTHVDVVTNSLPPATQYVITINPVWSVRVMKQIATSRNPDLSYNWVTQNG